jgi:hypothetical protein
VSIGPISEIVNLIFLMKINFYNEFPDNSPASLVFNGAVVDCRRYDLSSERFLRRQKH